MFDMFQNWDDQNKQADEARGEGSPSSATGSNSASIGYYNPKKTIVLSVGGSLFFDDKPKTAHIAKFCETVNDLIKGGFAFVLVVGGGQVARTYQASAKSLGANNFEMDEVGISVTKSNVLLFTYNIENAWKDVLQDVKMARKVLSFGRTPVFAGNMPGQTTDAVAASIAEYLQCDFCNLSNVDGIYASDPAVHPGTKMFEELTHTKMLSLVKAIASKPGAHTFVDVHAANILWRSKVRSFFINGSDLTNFKACIRGEQFKGTIVQTASASEEKEDEED
ncbi:MAG: UMP kinase [Candidatus Diapherotrites archaeon]|nr:UMP kinase [Candidatus Diapherotrites archaeon]